MDTRRITGRIGVVALTTALVALTPAGLAPASATESNQIEDHRTTFVEWYEARGTSTAEATLLFDRFASGTLLDSMTGVPPVSVSESEDLGWLITTTRYPDGSIVESRIETPAAADTAGAGAIVGPMWVGGCRGGATGTGYISSRECTVSEDNSSVLSIRFIADYTRNQGGNASIDAIYSPYAYAVGGTAPTPSLSTIRRLGNPAHARATTQYTAWHGGGSFTARVNLFVNGQRAWSTREGF